MSKLIMEGLLALNQTLDLQLLVEDGAKVKRVNQPTDHHYDVWLIGRLLAKVQRKQQAVFFTAEIVDLFMVTPELSTLTISFDSEARFDDEGGTYMNNMLQILGKDKNGEDVDLEGEESDFQDVASDFAEAFVQANSGLNERFTVSRAAIECFMQGKNGHVSAAALFDELFPDYALAEEGGAT